MTSDLGVAQKVFNIVWQNHQKFGKVIIRIGVFHTICSLFGAIGKHVKGSSLKILLKLVFVPVAYVQPHLSKTRGSTQ